MKVCKRCGEEIHTRDGENFCGTCEEGNRKSLSRKRAAQQRRERDAVLRSLGLSKVRGALGGTYWE